MILGKFYNKHFQYLFLWIFVVYVIIKVTYKSLIYGIYMYNIYTYLHYSHMDQFVIYFYQGFNNKFPSEMWYKLSRVLAFVEVNAWLIEKGRETIHCMHLVQSWLIYVCKYIYICVTKSIKSNKEFLYQHSRLKTIDNGEVICHIKYNNFIYYLFIYFFLRCFLCLVFFHFFPIWWPLRNCNIS